MADAALLWVLEGNDRAARFYEREGWRRDGATSVEQPYGSSPTSAASAAPLYNLVAPEAVDAVVIDDARPPASRRRRSSGRRI